MKELLDKLSSYNIFNYLFPGVLFAAIGEHLSSYSLILDDIIIGVFVYYFYGLVISRIGSLFLEPVFKWAHIIHFMPYADFVNASKIDNKIELFSEVNNMYRTLCSLFICLLLLRFFEFIEKLCPNISEYSLLIAIFIFALLFIFSYRKQTDYITSRITQAIQSKNAKERNGQ
ncbi:hypothetical protein ES703_102070 [subsurface metagenome]